MFFLPGFDSKPPSYDAAMFPDKTSASAPPANFPDSAVGGDAGFSSALRAAAAEPASDTESDDQSIDELQRRFNELTKGKGSWSTGHLQLLLRYINAQAYSCGLTSQSDRM